MKRIFGAGLAAVVWAGSLVAAPLDGDRTYDLLFRTGTLDEIDRGSALVYRREVSNTRRPDAAERNTGRVALTFRDGNADMAMLEFRKDDKHRSLGAFPAGVGNPIIMYFYESVVRDMAEASGGSPFYIRNRVKEAVIRPSEMEEGETQYDGKTVPTRTITLNPFRDDPNRDQMQGFGDMELRVTMSDEVPGWYVSLVAESSDGEVYRSELRFDSLDDTP